MNNRLSKHVDINTTTQTFSIFDSTSRGRVMTRSKDTPYKTLDALKHALMCFGYEFNYSTQSHMYFKEV